MSPQNLQAAVDRHAVGNWHVGSGREPWHHTHLKQENRSVIKTLFFTIVIIRGSQDPHHLWPRRKQDPVREQNRAEQVVTIPAVLWLHKHYCGLIKYVHLHTCVIGKAPVLSSGSAWRIETKVSLPSEPSPARKACITGMTDSSRLSHCTKPFRYCSRNDLSGRNCLCCAKMFFTFQANHAQIHISDLTMFDLLPLFCSWEKIAKWNTTQCSAGKSAWFTELSCDRRFCCWPNCAI